MIKLLTFLALSVTVSFLTGCVSSGSGIGIRSVGNSHFVIKNVEGNIVVDQNDNTTTQGADKTLDGFKAAANTSVQGTGVQQTKGNASVEPQDSESTNSGNQDASEADDNE